MDDMVVIAGEPAVRFSGWLAFTLYIGAAFNDATSIQRVALRIAMPAVLRQLRSDDPEVWKPAVRRTLVIVQQVMGADWNPRGDWDVFIRRMIDGQVEGQGSQANQEE